MELDELAYQHGFDSDAALLSALHPTPAAGGFPKADAVRRIAGLEPFDRGWYAGPIGWVGYDATEFALAIRSGLLADRELSVYGGAGVVVGSTAESEWLEIEHKTAPFVSLLSGGSEGSGLC